MDARKGVRSVVDTLHPSLPSMPKGRRLGMPKRGSRAWHDEVVEDEDEDVEDKDE